LAKLKPASVDLVFADPPFNIGYDYDVYHDRRGKTEYLAWTDRWLAAVRRVLKPTGSVFVAIGDEYAAEVKVRLDALGLTMRNWIVWHYTFGVNCTKKFSRSHAHIFYHVADAKRFTFNPDGVRVASARMTTYADRRANPVGKLPDDTWVLRPQQSGMGTRFAVVDRDSPRALPGAHSCPPTSPFAPGPAARPPLYSRPFWLPP
jgi:site-specific DNA-methyltransferase (adenine-specific)